MQSKRPITSRKKLDSTSPALENTQLRRSQLLQSFHFSCRRRVDEIANQAACFEELAETFPGLLFALATNYGTAEARRAAVAHLISGSRLREAANALGLPWWMRKLPPQAFNKRLETLPDDPKFSARIVNLLPTVPAISAKWLERVTQAYRICGPEFALWVARHDRFHAPLITDPALPYVAAWAWFADHPETLGGQLLRRPWTPNMSPRRAFDEVTAWRKRIRLALTLSSLSRKPWLSEGSALGYEFVELRTIEDFINESDAMDNCLDSFSEKLESGVSYVFSIRRNGLPVADIEIGVHPVDPTLPTIVQLRGPRNRRAHPEIWRAAYSWLGSQELHPVPPQVVNSAARRRAWRALWKPYLATLSPADREQFEKIALELDKLRTRRRTRTQRMRTATAQRPDPILSEDAGTAC
nr:MAG: hypothetical protein DIU57_04435 [Pseudomonadota bacterium]